jgi:hypothetical protein
VIDRGTTRLAAFAATLLSHRWFYMSLGPLLPTRSQVIAWSLRIFM